MSNSSTSEEEELHDIDWLDFDVDLLFDYEDPYLEHPQIRCVLNDDIQGLKRLLMSGRSVNITNNMGDTPLHIAVIKKKDALFSYLLTVEDIRLDVKDYLGETPLLLSVKCERNTYAEQLLELGADPTIENSKGFTPLHYARSTKIAKLLIEKGADVDARADPENETPILRACLDRRTDIMHLLIYYGADPTITDGNGLSTLCAAIWQRDPQLEQLLFPFFIDGQELEISWTYFYFAMRNDSPIFHQLCDACSTIVYCNNDQFETFVSDLLQLNPEYFKVFLSKFKQTMVDIFACLSSRNKPITCVVGPTLENSISILNTLDEYELLTDMVTIVLRYDAYFSYFHFITEDSLTLETKTQLALSLISHGIPLRFESLCKVYNKHGYCELFRILLHCDVCDVYIPSPKFSLMVGLIQNTTLSIEACLDHAEDYIYEDFALEMLEQFALPKLQQFCLTKFQNNDGIQTRLKALPTVPKLLEFARNSARNHIVKKFKMKNSRQLYTYIDHLKISSVYKDIMSFKRKLYL